MTEEIISWKEACKRGLKRYFTGKPCSYGHVSERQASDRRCVACNKARAFYDPDYQREWRRTRKNAPKRVVVSHYDRLRDDPEFRCVIIMRSMMYRSQKEIPGTSGLSEISELGYEVSEFRAHIEKQFLSGMHWNNHGQWHIDHIIPIVEFVKSGVYDLKRVHCLSNLRPIWARENVRKGDRVYSLV